MKQISHIEQLLIQDVKRNQFIFNERHPLNKNSAKRKEVFENVAKKVNKSYPNENATELQMRLKWNEMRKSFVKNVKNSKTSYYLFDHLKFLVPYITRSKNSAKMKAAETHISKDDEYDSGLEENEVGENDNSRNNEGEQEHDEKNDDRSEEIEGHMSANESNDGGVSDEFEDNENQEDNEDLLIITETEMNRFIYDVNDKDFYNTLKREKFYNSLCQLIDGEFDSLYTAEEIEERWSIMVQKMFDNDETFHLSKYLNYLKPYLKSLMNETDIATSNCDLHDINEEINSKRIIYETILHNIWIYEFLYNSKHVDYLNEKKKTKAYSEISKIVGTVAGISISGLEVKSMWLKLVKMFAQGKLQDQQFCIQLNFIKPFLSNIMQKGKRNACGDASIEEKFDESTAAKVDEFIISAIQVNKSIYDKTSPKYKDVTNKSKIFFEIGESIREAFGFVISGDQVQKRWDSLVTKFHVEDKKETAYKPSGTGANTPRNKWVFYDSLLFLKNFNSHSENIMDNFEGSSLVNKRKKIVPDCDDFAKKKSRNKDKLDDVLLTIGKSATTVIEAFKHQNSSYIPPVEMSPKIMVISEEFSKVSEEKKYACYKDIMSAIEKYV